MSSSPPTQASRKIDWPNISCAEYPKMRSALLVQLVTTPSIVLVMIASSENSTIAARCCNHSSEVLEMRNSSEDPMAPLRDAALSLDIRFTAGPPLFQTRALRRIVLARSKRDLVAATERPASSATSFTEQSLN